MTLRQAQSRFARMLSLLIPHAEHMGYEVTFGDAYRDPRLKAEFVRIGSSPRSLHFDRLAIDLNLFRNGKYLSSTEAHRPLGEYWESIGGAWGGRFQDGNHYSLEWQGRK